MQRTNGQSVLRAFDPAFVAPLGMACMREGFDAILIEREAEYIADIRRRINHVQGNDTPLFGGSTVSLPPPQGSCHLRTVRGRRIGPTGLRS